MSASNNSPQLNKKRIRSLRHAATLAADSHADAQQFDSEQKAVDKQRGSSHPLGHSQTSKIAHSSYKKTKVIALQDPANSYNDGMNSNENYSPRNVVAKMLMKKERKIPGSVYKPHSEEIVLLQSVALGQP